jgi:2-C-methyl-D-erythritol 4-phosphate cytidylyltransferase
MSPPKTFIIVPAAGIGSRMQAEVPKQYLRLNGIAILERTLQTLCSVPDIARIVIAIAKSDNYFAELPSAKRVQQVIGGATRAESVLAALEILSDEAQPDDWVLVHDAARPLITLSDIAKLRHAVATHPAGGILATPIADTLKQVDPHLTILCTLPRAQIWRALTPQMCRYGLLQKALHKAFQQQQEITDEAMALEQLGYALQIVEGDARNLKITTPLDLALAESLLTNP